MVVTWPAWREDLQRESLGEESVANRALADQSMTSRTHMVAVTGGSGSGKTWLAERLAAAFAPPAARVSLDDFYRDLAHLPLPARAGVNFDDPAAIDWHAVRDVVEGLERGEPVRLPQYDFATHTRKAEPRELAAEPIVIWDGLWLLHPDWLRARFAFSVFVDCPAAERLRRRTDRDVGERGRTVESVRRQFEQDVEPMHERFVAPQRSRATRCVTSPVDSATLGALIGELRAIVST